MKNAEIAPMRHIAVADALRAFAILAVVCNHLAFWSQPVLPFVHGGRSMNFSYLGSWGVACFFVLSGFLLTGPFLDAILEGRERFPSMKRFWTRRVLRIYPLYAFSVVAVGLAAALLGRDRVLALVEVGLHLTFLQDVHAWTINSLSGPFWTMAVDAEFYLLLPLLAYGAFRLTSSLNTESRRRAVIALVCGAIAFGVVFRYAILSRYPHAFVDYPFMIVVAKNVLGMSSCFALGAAIVLLRKYVPAHRVARWAPLMVAAAAAIAVFDGSGKYATPGPVNSLRLFEYATGDLLAALSAGLLLYGLSEWNNDRLHAIFRSRVVSTIAATAYAIYLFHFSIMEAFEVLVLRGAHGNAALVKLILMSLPCVLVAAYLAHVLIERPFLAIKDRQREPAAERHTSLSSTVAAAS